MRVMLLQHDKVPFWTSLPEQQKHWKSLSFVHAQKPVHESAHATRGGLCAQPDADVLENVDRY